MDNDTILQALNDAIETKSWGIILYNLYDLLRTYSSSTLQTTKLIQPLVTSDQEKKDLHYLELIVSTLQQRIRLDVIGSENNIKTNVADILRTLWQRPNWNDKMVLVGIVNSVRSTLSPLLFHVNALHTSLSPELQVHTFQIIQGANALKHVWQRIDNVLHQSSK
jgi:hypothetical protein